MTGALLNVSGIVIGGLAGIFWRRTLSPARESVIKVMLGAFTVYYGLRLTVTNLEGPFGQICRQLLIAVLSMMIGRVAGGLLHFQKASNRLGQIAKDAFSNAASKTPQPGEGFRICAALFCAAPLGILGAVEDGLSGYFYPLAVKAVIDGLATMSFISVFGRSVILSALPVLALEGTLTLLFLRLAASIPGPIVHSMNIVGGLLVFAVALVILQIKKIPLADYLPSLAIAPILTALFR